MKLLPVVRIFVTAAAAGLAGVAVQQAVTLGHARAALVETARDLRVEDPVLLSLLERAEDPAEARAVLARAVLVAAMSDAGTATEPAAGVATRRDERLEAAERLAREALALRPSSWRAAMVAGAAPYLRWSLVRDPRLLQEYRHWEAPLALAERLAPGHAEPVRYLATAYLELWPALSDAKRERARALLARAFEEPATYGRLLETWLDVSDGDLRPIPDAPWAWGRLEESLARRRDWPGYCRTWSIRRRSLHDRLRGELERGERLVAAGRLQAGRNVLFQVVAGAPVDRAFAGLVDRALRAAPFGPGRNGLAPPFGAWLEWALEHDLRSGSGADLPLSAEALARLRAVVAAGSTDPRYRAAAVWTYLAAGDLRAAARSERQSGSRWSEPWAPYWIVKARRQIENGEPAAARASLAEVHPEWRDHPAFRHARRALESSEQTFAAELHEGLGSAASGTWGTVWRWRGNRARLQPVLPAPAAGLEVGLAEAPPGGAAVALRWDGAVVGCRPVDSGVVRVAGSLQPGLHLLEVETLVAADGRVRPGAVQPLETPP